MMQCNVRERIRVNKAADVGDCLTPFGKRSAWCRNNRLLLPSKANLGVEGGRGRREKDKVSDKISFTFSNNSRHIIVSRVRNKKNF